MSTMPYDTGGPDEQWGEDGYAVSPEPVSPAVSPGVSRSGAPPASPLVALAVSPGGDGVGGEGNGGRAPLGWVGTDRWEPARDEPAAPVPDPGPWLRGLRAAVARSELLGGGPGGLLAELADPHPETMGRHLDHVLGHPMRPAGPWAGAAFVAGHLAVTGPAKAAGKTLIAVGTAFTYAGERIDWSGDRFARIGTAAAIAITLIVILVIFA